MSKGNPAASEIWPAIVLLLGLAVLAGGFIWPALSAPRDSVSDDQAAEYYEASLALQKAAIDQAAAKQNGSMRKWLESGKQSPDEAFRAAKVRFDAIKQNVSDEREGSSKAGFWLKIIGGVLATVGAIGHFAGRR